jgi:hypothetical protein
MRLSAADLAVEKHALVMRLSAGDLGGEKYVVDKIFVDALAWSTSISVHRGAVPCETPGA